MKNLVKRFGIIAFVAVIWISMAGCLSNGDMNKAPEFPSDFAGTWERVDQSISTITLTITSTTIKPSNQAFIANLIHISGDSYTTSPNTNPNLRGTIYLKLVGDYLEIIDAYDMSNASVWSGTEDDWTGTWKRK